MILSTFSGSAFSLNKATVISLTKLVGCWSEVISPPLSEHKNGSVYTMFEFRVKGVRNWSYQSANLVSEMTVAIIQLLCVQQIKSKWCMMGIVYINALRIAYLQLREKKEISVFDRLQFWTMLIATQMNWIITSPWKELIYNSYSVFMFTWVCNWFELHQ